MTMLVPEFHRAIVVARHGTAPLDTYDTIRMSDYFSQRGVMPSKRLGVDELL